MPRFPRCLRALALLILGSTCPAAAAWGQSFPVELVDAFPNLSFAPLTNLQAAPDGWFYVLEKEGRIWAFPNDPAAEAPTLALDIRDRVNANDFELGLLGIAFDPDYAANGYVYLDYTAGSGETNDFRSQISRFTRSTDEPHAFDPASEATVLEVPQPYGSHNAGAIAFGPPEGPSRERYFYVTLGDGGSGNDPQNNGQRLETLLGSILRLDVHGGGQPLDCGVTGLATIPEGNPFADGPGGDCDEIWAYGFRNPWRMALDEATGQFWIGDVGQFAWEEVDILERGGNFGWRPYEGNHCILGPCVPTGKTFPVWEFGHVDGLCAVIGGDVYRGMGIPELYGRYVFGDYCTGTVWALSADAQGVWSADSLTSMGSYSLTSFGTDPDGELLLVAAQGPIRRLQRITASTAEPAPALSAPALTVTGANPFRGRTTLRLRAEGPARVAVYDALGREVAVLFEGTRPSRAPLSLPFDAGDLPPGPYYVRLDGVSGTRTLALTVLR